MDQRILQYMAESDSEFVMEVTNKTKLDIKVCLLLFFADSRIKRKLLNTRVALLSEMKPFLVNNKVSTHV